MPESVNVYKKAASHSAIYGLSDILRKVVGFLMLPIYTHYLTPEEYGVVELMVVAISVMEVFLGMRMGQAIFRYYYLAKDSAEKKAVMSTAFLMTFVASVLGFIVLFMNAEIASKLLLGNTQYASLMAIFAIVLVTQALEEYGLIYVRVHQRPILFLGLSVVKLIIQLSLNIYFIVILELSVAGVIYSACISTAVMAVFSTAYTYHYSGIRFSIPLLKKLIMFSYPLWIAAVGSLYVGAADKYFLRVLSSLEDVGIYALAAKFGILIMVFVWSPFSKIWQSLRYEIYEMPEPNRAYKKIFISLMVLLSFIGLGISLFSGDVIRLMADEAFWPSGEAVPVLAMAAIVMSLTYFNNFGILLKEKTSIIAFGTYLNAFTITIAFLVLIPSLGVLGAAFSILIGSVVQLFWIEWRSKKLYDMQLPWRRAILLSIVWLSCYALSIFVPEALVLSILMKIAIVALFVSLVFLLPILEKEEKQQISGYMRWVGGKFINKVT